MRTLVDLHTHSTASDGTLSPSEIIHQADKQDLAAVALTDHDTVAGIAQARQAAREYPDLEFVAGIEVSADWEPESLHILGLCIDETCPTLNRVADFLMQARRERNPRIIEALQQMGYSISLDDVHQVASEAHGEAGGPVSRIHIAEAMRRRGIVKTKQDAFKKFIGHDGPAYVSRQRLGARETIEAIHEAGGLAILAHPGLLTFENRAQLERVIRSLMREGLDGLEAYHSSHNPIFARSCLDLGRRLGLAIAGGSDFHGEGKPGVRLGRPLVPKGALGDLLTKRIFG